MNKRYWDVNQIGVQNTLTEIEEMDDWARELFVFRRWEHDRVTRDSHSPEVTWIVIKLKESNFLICLFGESRAYATCITSFPVECYLTTVCFQQNWTYSNSIELIELNRTVRLVRFLGKFLWQFDFVRLPNLIEPNHVIKFDEIRLS